MLIRWDTLLIAAAVAGGSMMIENSHRIDTTAPDDEAVASAPDDCTAMRPAVYGNTLSQADEEAAAATPPACEDR